MSFGGGNLSAAFTPAWGKEGKPLGLRRAYGTLVENAAAAVAVCFSMGCFCLEIVFYMNL